MPAISPELISKMLHPDRVQEIYDTVTQPNPEKTPAQKAADERNATLQEMLDSRRRTLEQQRTDDLKRARINALGNALVTMVQPLGWAAGGATGGTIPYDNRQYLDAFNRSMKASDDIRSLADIESEFKFKLADEKYRRERELEDYQNKANIDVAKQREIFDMRSELKKEEIEGRIKLAEASARARYIFRIGGKAVDDAVRDELLRLAGAAYEKEVADYYNKRQAGEENVPEPPTYEDFLKEFAARSGYDLIEGGNSGTGSSRTRGTATGSRRSGSRRSGSRRSGDGRESGGLTTGGGTTTGGDGRESGGLRH